MNNPADSVADMLVTAGVGTFAATSGWGIFVGKLPETPHTAILVNTTGGKSPFPHLLLNFPSVQIVVRGASNNLQDAYNKISACVDALLGMGSQTVNSDVWRSCTQMGDIAFLGYDENQRPLHSANLSFIVEPASGTHRISIT